MAPPARSRARTAVALAAWLIWTAWVAVHYFTVPADPFVLLDGGELFPAPDWREAAARAVRAIAGAAIVTLAAWGAGTILVRRLRIRFTRHLEGTVVALALGFVAVSLGSLALAAAGVYRPVVVRVVLTLAAIGGIAVRVRRPVESVAAEPRMSGLDRLFTACAVAAMLFALVGALAPEIEYDALWYHLWLPVKWLEAGNAVDIVEEYVALYPLGWDLVSGAAMASAGPPLASGGAPVAAKLLHFLCLPLLAVTTGLLSRELFPRASNRAAAAIAVTAPVAMWEATTAYVDLALAWYIALSAYAVLRYRATGARAWLILGGVTMGMALATKNLGLVALAILGTALLVVEIRAGHRVTRALRTCALVAAIALALGAPWYARAYAASGNPVFPDLYAVFGAEPPDRWDALTERSLQAFKDHFGRGRSAVHVARLPWDVTVHGAAFGGTLGPVFVILVPAAVAGAAAPALLAACAAYALIWASPVSSLQLRFLVPLVPFLAVLAAEGLRRLPRAAGWLVAALLVMNLPPFVEWHEADRRGWSGWLTHVVRTVPVRVVIGSESADDYLARMVPSYRAWRYIDTVLPADARVLTFSGGDHLYSSRRRIWGDATMARQAVWRTPPGLERAARRELERLGVTHVLFDARQLAAGGLRTAAIGSDEMRRCCLEQIYEDGRFVLYRVR